MQQSDLLSLSTSIHWLVTDHEPRRWTIFVWRGRTLEVFSFPDGENSDGSCYVSLLAIQTPDAAASLRNSKARDCQLV